jgi:hypothetical protein
MLTSHITECNGCLHVRALYQFSLFLRAAAAHITTQMQWIMDD